MQTFPLDYIPRRGVLPSVKFKVRRVQFGDGYSQRGTEGVNSEQCAYPLTFALPHAQIAHIVNFLREHAGAKAFLWAMPNETLRPFTCAGYQGPKNIGPTHSELTATFELEYDL